MHLSALSSSPPDNSPSQALTDRGVRFDILAVLAGSVILNVLKEELPEERESRFCAFAVGAGTYAALLLTLCAPARNGYPAPRQRPPDLDDLCH